MNPGGLLIAALTLSVAVAACENDPPQVMGSAPTAEPLSPVVEALGHRRDASARLPPVTPGASASGATSSAPAAAAPDAPNGSAPPKAPKSPATATVACGDKPAPPCPLAAWMKANASPAITSQNFDALADVLDKTVAFAPPGYANWASIARDGADAARVQNLDAVKASCRSCHRQYRGQYKAQMRARPLLP